MQRHPYRLRACIPSQTLELLKGDRVVDRYPISTSALGIGTEEGSLRTPTGRFRIAEKIGEGEPAGTVFEGRVPVRSFHAKPRAAGVVGAFFADLAALLGRSRARDLVLTRILWLEGLDPENANTKERYIYLHGTNDERAIGRPASHGCLRLRNADIELLYDLVEVGTPVEILARRTS